MLFIYRALPLGGIETFFVRMAKARFENGKKTKILLTGPKNKSNPELLGEVIKFADVFFLEDCLYFSKILFRFIPAHFLIFLPLKFSRLRKIFDGVTQVHVSSAMFGFLYIKLSAALKIDLPLTIGIYHSREFIWEAPGKLPFYERMNRKLFFDALPEQNIVFFNERLVDIYGEKKKRNFSLANVFPLGVVVQSNVKLEPREGTRLSICSVGRLVSFKTYNLWMIDVVRDLKIRGVDVNYIVYGDGPVREKMQSKIEAYGLTNEVSLKGSLSYSSFSEVVQSFDLFVGSGTAIIESANSAVPSIVGIESITAPLTYGFLADIPGFTYNEDDLHEKICALDLILKYLSLSDKDKLELRLRHIEKAGLFSMETCVKNFEKIDALPLNCEFVDAHSKFYFTLRYSFSFFMFSLCARLKRKSLSDIVYG